jgi:non-specific serine/threonine protein kinase
LRQAWGLPLHAVHKTWRERWLGPLQNALGPETIACILAEGQMLSMDEAIDLALAEGQRAMAKESPPTPGAQHGSTRLLTPRQQEVAMLVAQGLTNHQIAERLVVTERAVAAHIEHILDRLGMSSRTQIAVWVAEHGLLAPTTAS